MSSEKVVRSENQDGGDRHTEGEGRGKEGGRQTGGGPRQVEGEKTVWRRSTRSVSLETEEVCTKTPDTNHTSIHLRVCMLDERMD